MALTFLGVLAAAGIFIAGVYWLFQNVRIGKSDDNPKRRK